MKPIPFNGIIFLITILCFSDHLLLSQTLQNDVIANAGENYYFGDKAISWTLGESIIESFHTDDIFISQGFHQPFIILLEIPVNAFPPLHLSVFPNPAEDLLQIEIPDPEINEHYLLTLYDINGKSLLSREIYLTDRIELDIRPYAAGMILLNIERESDGSKYYFKVIKTD